MKNVKNEFHDGIEVIDGDDDLWFIFGGVYWSQDGADGEYKDGSIAIHLPHILRYASEECLEFEEKFANVHSHEILHRVIHKITKSLIVSKQLDFINQETGLGISQPFFNSREDKVEK